MRSSTRAAACLAAAVGASQAVGGTGAAFLTPVPTGRLASGPSPLGGAAGRAGHTRDAGAGGSPLAASAAVAAAALLGAGAARAQPRRRREPGVAQQATRLEWDSMVQRIEGRRAVFTVTIEKPLGLVPANFPKRPGVGVREIKEGGNTEKHNEEVIIEGTKKGMFVLPGDEVVAVNGVDVEGKSLAVVGPLVKEAEGDTVTLKLCRNYEKGPVMVVWMPDRKMVAMKKGTLLRTCAETADANVRYNCKDGWCSSCWHADDTTMLNYRICKNKLPDEWDNVKPLVLLRADETFKSRGMLVKNLVQADGVLPPAPAGVNATKVRRQIESENVP